MSCKKKDDDTSPTAPKTTLSQRAGTYECTMTMIDGSVYTMEMIISSDGSIKIANIHYNKLDPTSTATSFIVSVQNAKYTIDFSTSRLIGAEGSSDNNTYSFTKK